MARNIMRVALVFILGASLSGCASQSNYSSGQSATAGSMEPKNPIFEELAEQGRMTTRQISIVYGVPCVEVMLKGGESIMTFVNSLPSLKKKSLIVQDRIALINGMHYLLVVNGSGNISTDKEKIFVPLDYSIEPKILPESV